MKGRRLRSLRAAPAFVAALCALAIAAPAAAAPSVWAKASDPRSVAAEEVMRQALKADLRFHQMARSAGRGAAPLVLREAKAKLAEIVAAGTRDFGARLLYVELLRDSNEHEEALTILKKLLKEDPPAPIRADVLAETAICHAIAGRREEEIAAYSGALAVQPHAASRARLLANRAEAFMAMGDLQAAVDGYREALAPLTTLEMFQIGSTTLFGLGVALDRVGNLQAGLDAVKLARSYDPIDRRLRPPDWFFSPAWDAHWYWALGGWVTGRSSSLWAARAEGYAKSVSEWELYILEAPQDDRWIPLARVRLAAVKREQAEMMKAYEVERKRAHEAEKDELQGPLLTP